MRRPSQTKPPSFLWQGLLIVLPVVLLAALGLLSLRQDRRLAEQDAQDRARELLRQLAPELGRSVGNELARFRVLAREWEKTRTTWLQTRQTNVPWSHAWSAAFSNLDPEQTLFEPAIVTLSGEALRPRMWTNYPTPPSWFASLTLEQGERWEAARTLEGSDASSNRVAEAWRRVIQLNLPAPAQASVDLALLQLQARTNPPDALIERLCRFGEEHPYIQSESGLPLAAVSFAMALRLAQADTLNDVFLSSLDRQLVSEPSLLVPFFLKECERRSRAGPAPAQAAVAVAALTWQRQERWRELFESARTHLDLHGPAGSNVWFDAPSGRWLASASPNSATRVTAGPDRESGRLEERISISFIPKQAITRIFERALRQATAAWPAYFKLRAELEGERMTAERIDDGHNWRGAFSGSPLASASGALSESGLGGSDLSGLAGTVAPSAEASWVWPPSLSLSVYLGDPVALYARQRQRTVWFGGLILAVAAAAVTGFVRARRAFFREHQLSELKTNFVSSVSHELRAPIASVRLMAESLERGAVRDPSRQAEYFGLIVRECRRLSALVANVLDFSRIEQGRKEYEFEPTDVVELVRETVKLMGVRAAENQVGIETEFPAALAHGEGSALLDGRAMQQALVNLLDNAFKHAPKQSVIKVSVRQVAPSQTIETPGGCWQIAVEDQGPGIAASEHERIFERFYRLGSELRRDTPGVGIGLSIVKHIVEAHRGCITVESAPGQGSRFTMEFPAI